MKYIRKKIPTGLSWPDLQDNEGRVIWTIWLDGMPRKRVFSYWRGVFQGIWDYHICSVTSQKGGRMAKESSPEEFWDGLASLPPPLFAVTGHLFKVRWYANASREDRTNEEELDMNRDPRSKSTSEALQCLTCLSSDVLVLESVYCKGGRRLVAAVYILSA